jgi:hypothetical protein
MKSIRSVDSRGNIFYSNENDKKHREDGPAVILITGEKQWRYDGKYHRLDGPAHIWHDSDRDWYIYGRHHRIGGPSVTRKNAWNCYYRKGLQHRLNAPSFVAIGKNFKNAWWEFGIQIK